MSFLDQRRRELKRESNKMSDDNSKIIEFYRNKSVLLTGSTGFVGKVLLEKLLRMCEVRKIYLLMRAKKGVAEEKRIDELFASKCFDLLKNRNEAFRERIEVIQGDCALPFLGVSEASRQILIDDVDVVLHCAATVRFNEELRRASYINVRATQDLIRLAKCMKNLKSFVHVSTAYSNCTHKTITEDFYKAPMSAEQLMKCLEAFDDDLLQKMTPLIIGDWPNTYTFTKCIAEDVIRLEGSGLPITILRPSIVIPSHKEPIMGWVDSFSGMSAYIFYIFTGFIRVSIVDENVRAEAIPCDFIANGIIAASWKAFLDTDRRKATTTIYNAVSTPEAPLTYGQCLRWSMECVAKYPFSMAIWYPMYMTCTNRQLFSVLHFFLHYLPACLYDFFFLLLGKKSMFLQNYQKIFKFVKSYETFTTNNWQMNNRNMRMLWDELNDTDRALFEFSMHQFDWLNYFERFTLGLRLYLANDPLATLDASKRKYRFFKIGHYTLISLLWFYFLSCISAKLIN